MYLDLLQRWEKQQPELVATLEGGSVWFHWNDVTPVWFSSEDGPNPLSLAVLSHYILTQVQAQKLDLSLTINSVTQSCIAAIVQDTQASGAENDDHTLALMEAWVSHLENAAKEG